MYAFADTTGAGGSDKLPSEALSINGSYIEQQIEGYRTLYVQGRELTETEIKDLQIGLVDGSIYQGRRTPARELTIGYQLIAKDPEDFRKKYNKLNGILRQEEAKLVFADEPDKYWIGTKSAVKDVPPGRLSITSEFSFFCSDPKKRANIQKEFQAAPNEKGIMELTIVNDGTESVPIDYEIFHNHENGYVGIVSADGAIQYGSTSETDTVMSKTLIDFPTGDKIQYTPGGKFSAPYILNGAFRVLSMNGRRYLQLDPTSMAGGNYWYGAGGYIPLPDYPLSGQKQIKNFKAAMGVWLERSGAGQTGAIDLCLTSGTEIVASIQLWYGVWNDPRLELFVGNKRYDSLGILPEAAAPFRAPGCEMSISKRGGLFSFKIAGISRSWRIDELKDKTIDGINFSCTQDAGRTYDNMVWAGIDRITFRADTGGETIDIPNRYEKGSVLTVDGNKRKVYLNGAVALEDEMTGSTYFDAHPGETKVQFFHSNFSTPAPTCKARIREAWL